MNRTAESESEFDRLEAFKTFSSFWKHSKKPNRTFDTIRVREIFLKLVKVAQDWERLKRRLEIEHEDGTLGSQIRFLLKFQECEVKPFIEPEDSNSPDVERKEPQAEAQSTKTADHDEDTAFFSRLDSAGIYPETVDKNDVKRIFAKVWRVWPRNTTLEEPRKAFNAMWTLAKGIPLSDIEKTCICYAMQFKDPSSGMVHPYHLKTLLEDSEKFAAWRAKATLALSDEDSIFFDATWSWYPAFTNKNLDRTKKDSAVFWMRHVSVEDRWNFLSAVKKYRLNRREASSRGQHSEEVEKYTASFISFVATWREQDFYRLMAGDICDGIMPLWRKHGFASHETCDTQSFITACLVKTQGKGRDAIEKAVEVALTNARLAKMPLLAAEADKDAIIKEMCEKALDQACKPPR